MSSERKIILKTIFTVLIIEVSIVASLWAFFYYNYETYATSKSWVSKKINLQTKKINFSKIKIKEEKNSKESNFYEWEMWEVKEVFTRKKDKWKLAEIKVQTFKINEDNIKKAIIINILKKDDILDKYTYFYLKKQNKKNLEKELNKFLNFQILLWNIKKEKSEEYKKEWLKSYKAFIIKSTVLIKQDKYWLLSKYLELLEKNYLDTSKLKEQNIPKNSILLSDNLKYVLNKLLNNKEYNNNIINASQILGIDKNILLTSVWVEQIRHMTTTRWYAKKLIKQNKYLTNFSKFSYWLWWIKIKTARQIQSNTKIYNKSVYGKYLSNDVKLSDNELIWVLRDDYKWLIYASSLISNIQKRWLKEWYSLEDKPWVVITLYNMGNPQNKKPHKNPDLWWSLINIEWKSYYFWEIGYLLYYYLKYYIK